MQTNVAEESPLQPDVLALLAQSDAFSRALYPPASSHLLPAEALAADGLRFVVARSDGVAVGIGALRLDKHGAEIKRMFVACATRGLHVGRDILRALETATRAAGLSQVRLETGIHSHAALSFYRGAGCVEIGPFGDYVADPLSIFMAKTLLY